MIFSTLCQWDSGQSPQGLLIRQLLSGIQTSIFENLPKSRFVLSFQDTDSALVNHQKASLSPHQTGIVSRNLITVALPIAPFTISISTTRQQLRPDRSEYPTEIYGIFKILNEHHFHCNIAGTGSLWLLHQKSQLDPEIFVNIWIVLGKTQWIALMEWEWKLSRKKPCVLRRKLWQNKFGLNKLGFLRFEKKSVWE